MKHQRTGIIIVGLLLAIGRINAGAQEIRVNEQKLREAIKLPQVSIAVAFNFTKPDEVELLGDSEGYARKIAALQERSKTRPNDGLLWFQIGELYEQAKQQKEAESSYKRAVTLLRKQIAGDTDQPAVVRARNRALLGKTLREWSEGDDAEAEKWLREAVALAPDDGSVWADLGKFLATQTDRYAYTEEQRDAIKKLGKFKSLAQYIREAPVPSADGIAKAKLLFAEARKCGDRAAALDSKTSAAYLTRFAIRQSLALSEVRLTAIEKQETDDSVMMAAILPLQRTKERADLHLASRYGTTAAEIGMSAINEWAFVSIMASQEGNAPDPNNAAAVQEHWKTYPTETRDTVEHAIERLGQLASADAAQKPLALALRGLLEFGIGKHTEATITLRAVLEARPTLMNVREILIGMAVDAKDFDQIERLLREIPAKDITIRHHIMLAKVYQQRGDLPAQKEQTDLALKRDPNDPTALLAAAAIALKHEGNQPGALAAEHLEKAKKQMKDDDERMWDWQRLYAIHTLLYGKKIEGFAMLKAMANSDENNPQFKELLAAIEN